MGNAKSREDCQKLATAKDRAASIASSDEAFIPAEKCYFLPYDAVSALFKRQSSIGKREMDGKSREVCEKLCNAEDRSVRMIPPDKIFVATEKCYLLQPYDAVAALFKRQSSIDKTEGSRRSREACDKLSNCKDRPGKIVPSDKVFLSGTKCYLLPYDAMSTLFKRQSIDKTDFTELFFPFPSIYSSSARVPPFRSKKSPRKNRRYRKSSTRAHSKKLAEEMSQEAEQKLQKRKHEAKDTGPTPRYTLAEHIKSSSEMENSQRESSTTHYEAGNDEEEAGKHQPEVAMLIESAHAFLQSRRQGIRGRRRCNVGGKRRTRWVPKLQTLQECSP